ncbi:peptide/bleomycin uptake transporter [Jezberella montanilacus]|uniref:Peptide/bleomycin uptake transporter n=1 Tax=Jezberella montanilacus TaxID=323426 RepID=A0A2T0XFZ8_9BURK|nr:putative transporter [Jezberella montanilacus]PRY97878.1 peptide/bleomycin uptake transporter [Jezberella montanilacus]
MFSCFFMKREWLIWAWGGLSFMVGLVLLTVWQTVRLNEWFRGFFDLLQKPAQQDGLRQFWGFAQTFAWIAFPYIFLRSLENLLASHYVFRWRQALTTEYLPRWKNTPTEIEGASQRIQEDCMRFARQTESLGLGLIRAVITLLSFIPILWGLSTDMTITWLHFDGSLLWLALLAAIGGTVISWVVGRLLPELEYNNQKVEAAFRKKLVYAEDQRDCLVLSDVMSLFRAVKANNFRLFNHYAYFNLWANLYQQAMIIFPYLLMAPSLFSGLITLGVIQQVGNAFGKVNESFSYLIDRWTDITELRSIYKRLCEFERSLYH